MTFDKPMPDASWFLADMKVRAAVERDQRLIGALISNEAATGVLTEALRSMVEAWFILAQIAPSGSLLERSEQAVEVLEQGIAELKFALNEGPEPS